MQDLSNEAKQNNPRSINRRTFVKTAATLAAATALPASFLAACGSVAQTATTASGPTTVTFSFMTYADISQGVQAVQTALNATSALKAKNLSIKFDNIDSASYTQKMTLRFSSGQPMDALFTASWINDFYNNVAQGNLLALDDLLTQYAPKLKASMSSAIFDAARVNGKLYGIPNQQLFPKMWGALLRKDLATKYTIDLTKVKTYADLTPILALLKQKEPTIIPLLSDNQPTGIGGIYNPETHGVDEVAGGLGVGVKYTDTSLTAYNHYDTPEFLADAKQTRAWFNAGYYLKNPPSVSDSQASYKAGKYAFVFDQARPEEYGKFKTIYGYDEVQALLMTPFLDTSAVVSGLVGIARSSQHPQQAMELLEIINSDPTVYNLICHGIAGKDYTLADPKLGYITVPSNSQYTPSTDWEFGNQFNGYYTDQTEAQANVWQTSKALNQQAPVSVAMGFAFDPTNVKTQVAQVGAAITQYVAPVSKGLVDPTTGVSQFLSALKQAGIDDIVKETQTQLDSWKKTK